MERLLRSYAALVARPWDVSGGSGTRTWFAVYPPEEERRLRARLLWFEQATRVTGHPWIPCDLTKLFAEWLSAHRYREAYFEAPHDLRGRLREFREVVSARVAAATAAAGFEGVVALTGLASVRGFVGVPEVLEDTREGLLGRLLVFFPGEFEKGEYRFLDARDRAPFAVTNVAGADGAPLP